MQPAELADIQKTGVFRNLGQAEGKYFTTSAEGASSYAKQAVNAFGDPPYTMIKTEVPTSQLTPLMKAPHGVDGGIPAYVVPDAVLPTMKPNVMNSMPIPKS